MSAQKILPDIEHAIALCCAHPCDIEHARRVITTAGTVDAAATLRGLVYLAPREKTAEIEEIRFSVQQARTALLLARSTIGGPEKTLIALDSSHSTITTLQAIDNAINRLDGCGCKA